MNKVEWVFYYIDRKDDSVRVVTSTGTFAKPDRSNNYKELKKMFGQANVKSIGYIRKEKFDTENEIYSRPTYHDIITKAKKDMLSKHGDLGSCVLGMRLLYKSVPVAEQIVQGSITNEYYFDEVKKQLVEKLGYVSTGFDIQWGRMD